MKILEGVTGVHEDHLKTSQAVSYIQLVVQIRADEVLQKPLGLS